MRGCHWLFREISQSKRQEKSIYGQLLKQRTLEPWVVRNLQEVLVLVETLVKPIFEWQRFLRHVNVKPDRAEEDKSLHIRKFVRLRKTKIPGGETGRFWTNTVPSKLSGAMTSR
ncbi:hypothetical protein J6590_007332 [Homalodisca vitripennis]|nr:hypothetical protein J6590_007332 [Homalodisca vitripennis]